MDNEQVGVAQSLPFNRKERFFTATVLPMIIGCNEFRYLHLFLERCGLSVRDEPSVVTWRELAFYSEYGYAESAIKSTHPKSKGVPGDTPDLVLAGRDWLLAVEAKMYMKVSDRDLAKQYNAQQAVVRALTPTSEPAPIVRHVFLLPEGLVAKLPGVPGPFVTWQQVLSDYEGVAPGYWTQVLRHALASYDDLAATTGASGANGQGRKKGKVILDLLRKGSCEYTHVGRQGGLAGLEEDVADDAWREKRYEVALWQPDSTKNWMTLKEFVTTVTRGEEVASFEHTYAGSLVMRSAVFFGPDRLERALKFRHWVQMMSGVGDVTSGRTVPLSDGSDRAEDFERVAYVMRPDYDVSAVSRALRAMGGLSDRLGDLPDD